MTRPSDEAQPYVERAERGLRKLAEECPPSALTWFWLGVEKLAMRAKAALIRERKQ